MKKVIILEVVTGMLIVGCITGMQYCMWKIGGLDQKIKMSKAIGKYMDSIDQNDPQKAQVMLQAADYFMEANKSGK